MTTKSKTINGLTFELSQPYAEGHVITEAEARALNQTRSENIGNNLRTKIKELQEDASLSEAQVQSQAADLVAEADASYVFTLAAVGASAKRDPYETEARKLARGLLKEHLASTGRKITSTPEGMTDDEWADKIDSELDRIAALEPIVKAAKKNVDARRKQGESLATELGIEM